MPLARCITKCWDSQLTKLYYPGDVAEFQEDHIFIKGKIQCFQIIGQDELSKTPQETDAKLQQMATKIADLTKKVEKKNDSSEEVKTDSPKEDKEKRVFKCSICDKEFSNGFDVGKHRKADHPQP